MKYQLYMNASKKIYDYRLLYLNDMYGNKMIFYDLSRILELSEFVWTLRSSV